MRILVVGLIPYESGKTEFVSGLSSVLEQLGFKTGYFKPVAGHDGWYQYDTLLYSMDKKLLIGHDAYVIAEKLGLLDKLHLISPLDIFTLPVDPVKLGLNMHVYDDHMSYIGKRVVIMRFTRFLDNEAKNYRHVYFVCRDTIDKLNNDLRRVYDELLTSLKTSESSFIDTVTSHVEKLLHTPQIYEIIDTYINYLGEYDPLIIEGYNDVSSPTLGSLNVDYVFVVAPGKALLYSGERYRMAVNLLSYRGYPWMIKSSNVVEVVGKPLRTYDIPVKIYGDRLSRVFEEIVEFIIGDRV